jgi:hypothetical protein
MDGLLLLHTPPVVVLVNVVVLPVQMAVIPVVALTVGEVFTVSVVSVMVLQPALAVTW